jgi:transposase InsO family protein
VGWGRAARYLSRVIRLCLRFDVEPIFIPPGQPQYNGSVENFNSWFQPLLFQRRFTRPADLKRELNRLQDTVNSQHVDQRLAGLTPAQYRKRQKLQLLPQSFTVPTQRLPVALGRVTFIRMVSANGNTLATCLD